MEAGDELKAEKSPELARSEGDKDFCTLAKGKRLGLLWGDHHRLPRHSPGATSLGNDLLSPCDFFFKFSGIWLESRGSSVLRGLGDDPTSRLSRWQLWKGLRQPPQALCLQESPPLAWTLGQALPKDDFLPTWP